MPAGMGNFTPKMNYQAPCARYQSGVEIEGQRVCRMCGGDACALANGVEVGIESDGVCGVTRVHLQN
jgi:hypothetical protein